MNIVSLTKISWHKNAIACHKSWLSLKRKFRKKQFDFDRLQQIKAILINRFCRHYVSNNSYNGTTAFMCHAAVTDNVLIYFRSFTPVLQRDDSTLHQNIVIETSKEIKTQNRPLPYSGYIKGNYHPVI